MTQLDKIAELAGKLIADGRRLQYEIDLLQKDCLTTTEFAHLKELSPKTVTNHCLLGHYDHCRRVGGCWQIHRCELHDRPGKGAR